MFSARPEARYKQRKAIKNDMTSRQTYPGHRAHIKICFTSPYRDSREPGIRRKGSPGPPDNRGKIYSKGGGSKFPTFFQLFPRPRNAPSHEIRQVGYIPAVINVAQGQALRGMMNNAARAVFLQTSATKSPAVTWHSHPGRRPMNKRPDAAFGQAIENTALPSHSLSAAQASEPPHKQPWRSAPPFWAFRRRYR